MFRELFYPESLGIIAFNFPLRCPSLFISTYFVSTPLFRQFRDVNEANPLIFIPNVANAASLCLALKRRWPIKMGRLIISRQNGKTGVYYYVK